MKITLEDGREIQVGVEHTNKEVLFDYPGQLFRGTRVLMTMDDGLHISVRSVCKPPDPFCKFDGRKRAAVRLVESLRDKPELNISRKDMGRIVSVILPEATTERKKRVKKEAKK